MSAADLTAPVERFLFREAALLDEQRLEAWLDLFTADGTYWVPAAPDQPDPFDHVSLFYEDRALMAMRIARLRHPHAPGAARPVRTTRMVGNVLVTDGAGSEIAVRSCFQLIEAQAGRTRLFAGTYRHRLTAAAGDFRIKQKRVDLVDADAAHEAIQIFL